MAQYPLNNNTNLTVYPIQTDIVSSAITTTTSTSSITPSIGSSFVSSVIVTAVSGTLPSMLISIEQSIDGTTWSNLYTYPTITTTGTYNSPQLAVNLGFIRYTQTIAGTTPSFTRSILRNQINTEAGNFDNSGKLQVRANLAETIYTVSTSNNTSTQLAAAATFTGAIESMLSYPNLILSIRCDTSYTITIDQFSDLAGTIQYAPSIIYTRSAGIAFNQSISIAGSYFRLKITNNGGTTTTTLFAESFFGILPTLPNVDNNGNLPTSSSVAADATPSNISITAADIVSTNTTGQNGQIFYTGSPTTNSFANYALSSNEGVSVQTTGTWVGSMQSELSTDGGTTWIPVTMSQTGLHTYVTSFTGNVNAKVNTAGATNFRIRCTAYTSGTCIVKVIQTANIGTTQLSTAVNVSNPVFFIDRSGTITTGGVAQVLSPANSSRGVLKVMNTSNAVLYINELGTATLSAPSYVIMPNQEFSFSDGMPLSAVSIIGATTGQSFTAREANGSPNINTNVLGGIVPVGQTASATALSVVPSTDIYTPTPILYTVTTAGTGYVIGDLLQQSFNQTSAGVLTDKWINVTQKTVLATTPSIANIASNLKLATELNGSTFSDSIQKEWKCVTATGTPTAAVGDILIQSIKSNNNTINVTWFNMTTSTLFTVAPVVTNLFDLQLGATNCGREEFSLYTPNAQNLISANIQNAVFSYRQGNASIVTTQAGYTVPAGKKLRIHSIEFQCFQTTSITFNNDGSVGFYVCYDYGGVIPTIASARGISASGRWMWIPPSTNANNSAAVAFNSIPDGAFEIPSNAVIRIGHQAQNWAGVTFHLSVKGYLYNN
jgi:hypothetical protein